MLISSRIVEFVIYFTHHSRQMHYVLLKYHNKYFDRFYMSLKLSLFSAQFTDRVLIKNDKYILLIVFMSSIFSIRCIHKIITY